MSASFWHRARHLSVGALLVAGYYAGLPGHLWEMPAGFQAPLGGLEPVRPAWSVTEIAASPELADVQLADRDNGLVAFWREGRSLRLAPVGGSGEPPVVEVLPGPEADRGVLLQAVLVSAGTQPVILLRRQGPLGHHWYRLHGAREQRLPLGSLPGINWRAGPAVRLADGGAGLPLHAPGPGRLALLRLGPEGEVRGMHSAGSADTGAAPPRLLVDSRTEALLLPGPHSLPRVTGNGGIGWRLLRRSLPEDVSADFALVRRGEGRWWLFSVARRDGREILRVHETADRGGTWRRREAADLETGATGDCADTAPVARHSSDGQLHLLHVTGDCRLLHARLVAGEEQ